MDCIKCGFKLVDGQQFCPRCGASQTETQDNSQGISMELPEVNNESKKAPVKKMKKPVVRKKKAEKAKPEKTSVMEVDIDETEEGQEAKNNKSWLYAVIGIVAVAVILFVAYLIIGFEPKGSDDENYVMIATTEDEIILVEGEKLTEIAEMPEDLYLSDILTAINDNSFYYISDAEYDDDSGEYLGDLIFLKSNGKETEIDSDVVAGSQTIVGKILWFEKADGDERIVCSYDGRKVLEVIEEDTLSTWYGTNKPGKAYYTLIDEDDYTSEVFVIENGDEESIMDESQIVALSSDYNKAVLITEDDGESIVNIFDGKDDFEVIEDVQDILINSKTLDMIVVADEDDMVLYYIPYGKEEIEIDDEVTEIIPLMIQIDAYSYMVEDLGSMIYYGKDDDLYVADFKGKDNDRILKDYEDIEMINFDLNSLELAYADDDEVVTFNFKTLKETSVELPDADDLASGDVAVVGKWYVYRTEDNKEIFAYDGGRKDPIELSDDADEIMSFDSFMDKYILWLNDDSELIIAQMREDSDEEVGDEVYDFWTTSDGGIYFLSDYEDGEGDLYYMPKYGKDAQKLEKDITGIRRLYYK